MNRWEIDFVKQGSKEWSHKGRRDDQKGRLDEQNQQTKKKEKQVCPYSQDYFVTRYY
jgi:hypothetical protein